MLKILPLFLISTVLSLIVPQSKITSLQRTTIFALTSPDGRVPESSIAKASLFLKRIAVRKIKGQPSANVTPPIALQQPQTEAVEARGQRTDIDFSTLQISENTKRALSSVMKFTSMTKVQAEAIPEVLAGNDVFVKSKTGTGKTLAFLIPGIEMLLKELQRHSKGERAMDRGDTSISSSASPLLLILSPTRELAAQIADEAKALLTFHRLGVITLVGGVDVSRDVRALSSRPFDIVVATPGRLLMHLEETRGFTKRLSGVKFLVLDEADRLLDMGFKRDINKIAAYLPSGVSSEKNKVRQTLLFSATFSNEIKEVASTFLRKNYSVIDTVGEEVEQTHQHVLQNIVSVRSGDQIEALKHVIDEHRKATNPHKIMVFFPTARQTAFMANLFNAAKYPVVEIHSRKSQPQRTRASEEFRASRNGIMFSSDVTARGMDYPDVTLVIMMGMTTRDQYVHRLGRTARAGKEGSGVLLCSPDEFLFMSKELKGMPLTILPTESVVFETKTKDVQQILDLRRNFLTEADSAWGAWLGYYNSETKRLGWTSEDLFKEAKLYAQAIGLSEIPILPTRTLSKMGLSKAAGFRSEVDTPRRNSDSGRTGGRDRGVAKGRDTSTRRR